MTPLITDTELLLLGVASDALAAVPVAARDAARASASAIAVSYLAKRFKPPFTAVDDDTKMAIAQIAQWQLLARRGFDPSRGNDQVIRQRYEDAIAWLSKAAIGEVEPIGLAESDASPGVAEASPLVATSGTAPLWPVYGASSGGDS